MDANTVVISLGGSLLVPQQIDQKFLRDFREVIVRAVESGQRFAIFCGGGQTARAYQEGLKSLGATNTTLDWVGIYASRLNAQLVRLALGDLAVPEIIVDPKVKVESAQAVVVGAGWLPGWSTDYDAIQYAITIGASRVINLTNIDYVYDSDPRKFPNAQPYTQMTWTQLRELVGNKWQPGLNAPFDPIAAKLAQEKDVVVVVANGNDLTNLREILQGGIFKGTVIANKDVND